MEKTKRKKKRKKGDEGVKVKKRKEKLTDAKTVWSVLVINLHNRSPTFTLTTTTTITLLCILLFFCGSAAASIRSSSGYKLISGFICYPVIVCAKVKV
jgi:hypothetical protein